MKHLIPILAAMSATLLPPSARADSECSNGFPLISIDPFQPLVEARIVFIAFPDDGDIQSLPSWAEEMESEIPSFIETMSGGLQQMNLTIARRPAPNEGLTWVAADSLSHYNSGGPPGMGHLTAEIMTDIHDSLSGPSDYWESVDQVFVIYHRCIGFGGFGGSCTNSGVSSLQIPATITVPGFDGDGTTQQMEAVPTGEAQKYIAAHEYGHRL